MSWTEINLAGLSDEMERLPEGEYTLALLAGAKYGRFDAGKIEVGAKVVDGEYKNRVIYFSYPNPDKQDWSPNALKRLESAMKKDGAAAVEDGQDPVAYLNQEDVVGSKFVGSVVHREYQGQDGETKQRTELQLFKVKPVSQVA